MVSGDEAAPIVGAVLGDSSLLLTTVVPSATTGEVVRLVERTLPAAWVPEVACAALGGGDMSPLQLTLAAALLLRCM